MRKARATPDGHPARRIALAFAAAIAFGVAMSILKGSDAGVRNDVGNLSAPWLLVPFFAAASVRARSQILGAAVGLAAGVFGGVWDDILMRLTDIFLAFPALILAMAISAALGPSLTNVMIAVAAVSWPNYARLMRSQVLSLRGLEFVAAARSLGASPGRVAWRHLLPNSLSPLLVQASFDVGGAILTAAGLGFIGFGAQPPTPEWGAMVSETRNFIVEAPWASSAPALTILVTVLALNLLGDGLRDVLDPRGQR